MNQNSYIVILYLIYCGNFTHLFLEPKDCYLQWKITIISNEMRKCNFAVASLFHKWYTHRIFSEMQHLLPKYPFFMVEGYALHSLLLVYSHCWSIPIPMWVWWKSGIFLFGPEKYRHHNLRVYVTGEPGFQQTVGAYSRS